MLATWRMALSLCTVFEAICFSPATESETSLPLEQDGWSQRSDADVQAVHPQCASSGHGAKPKLKAVSVVIIDLEKYAACLCVIEQIHMGIKLQVCLCVCACMRARMCLKSL